MDVRMAGLIASTAQTWAYLQSPERASGACSEMAWRFQCVAAEASLRVTAMRCLDHLFTCDTMCVRFADHFVNVYDGYVIDWTARQFWSACQFPFVEPVTTYRNKWMQFVPVRDTVWS